jgi:ABC-type nitrate/sulfonate/bicarbonate transport system substrate-binding protein
MNVGVESGIFADAAISGVETRTFTAVPAMMTAVAKGQVDAGSLTFPPVWSYNTSSTGDDLVAFSTFGSNLTAWYAREGSGLNTVEEAGGWEQVLKSWKGRTIGLPALGGQMDNELRYMLEKVGLNPDTDVEMVQVGGGPTAVAAVDKGLVDIVGGGTSVGGLLETQGKGYTVVPNGSGPEELVDTIASVYFASQSKIEEKEELFSNLADALEATRDYIADEGNRESVGAVLTDKVGLPANVAESVYEVDRVGISKGALDQQAFDKTIEALVATNSLPGDKPSFEQLVATGVVG